MPTLKERLERSKLKRKRAAPASTAAVLSSDKDMHSAASWVKRSRIQPSKAAAEDVTSSKSSSSSTISTSYKSNDLEGLVVGHDLSSFKEGESVILTLADTSVLDDDAPNELQNANMADADRLKFRKDREKKLKKPLYAAYDDGDDDDDLSSGLRSGLVTKPKMLAQYDQEDNEKIVRERKKTIIGSGGTIDPAKKREAEERRRREVEEKRRRDQEEKERKRKEEE